MNQTESTHAPACQLAGPPNTFGEAGRSRLTPKSLSILPDIAWGLLAALLFFLPFQGFFYKFLHPPNYFSYLDEIAVVLLIGLAVTAWYRERRFHPQALLILLPLCLVGGVGIFSGLYNGNRFWVTILGTHDYIKNFLPIAILAYFMIETKKVLRLYKILRALAIFFCLVAIGQEVLFLMGVPPEKMFVSCVDIRFGLIRTPSLLGHANALGLYALLFFILELSLSPQRINWIPLILFSGGIFLSLSRIVWVAYFLFVLYILIISRKKILLIWAIIGLVLVSSIFIRFTMRLKQSPSSLPTSFSPDQYFRTYTIMKSLEIWKDHPVVGVGPGMYGGVISYISNSPIYKQYNFDPRWYNLIKSHRMLDQYWGQILAEMGLLGGVSFLGLFAFLFWLAWRNYKLTPDPIWKNIFLGFSFMPMVILLYGFGQGLNVTHFLLTYSVLLGLSIGIRNNDPALTLPK